MLAWIIHIVSLCIPAKVKFWSNVTIFSFDAHESDAIAASKGTRSNQRIETYVAYLNYIN